MAYGDRFIGFTRSLDGRLYRVRIARDGYEGEPTELAMGGPQPLVLTRGQPGDPDLYQPIPTGRLTATFVDGGAGAASTGLLSEVAAAPLGRYLAVLEDYDEGAETGSALWWGFLAPERYRDEPFATPRRVTVQAVEGWALLKALTLDGDREVTYLMQWAAAAMGYAAGTRIYSAGLWRPWLPQPQLATRDPLRVVVPLAALVTDQGDPLDGLRLVQEAFRTFGVRAVQGPDPNGQGDGVAWWLLLRDALRGGTADVWYRRVGGLDFGGPDATDFVFDEAAEMAAGRLRLERAPGREIVFPVRRLVSTFAAPALENLVANGSFETADPVEGDDVAYRWTMDPEAGAERLQLSEVTGPSYTATYGNEYCLILWGYDEDDVVGVVQEDYAAAPGGGTAAEDAACLRLRYLAIHIARTVPMVAEPAWLFVTLSNAEATYYVAGEAIVVGTAALAGATTIGIEPLFAGVSGAVAGTLALPAGTRLLFRDTGESQYDPVEVRLARPAYVGDARLYVEATGSALAEGLEALGCYLTETRSPVPHYQWYTDPGEFAAEDHALCLLDPTTGEAIGDAVLGIEIEHPWSSELSGEDYYDELFALFDAFQVEVWKDAREESGEASFSYTSEAESEDETHHGLDVELREFLVGDGPTVDSTSGLQAYDGNGDLQPTMQGANTGWKEGSYADEEPSTGEAFVALRGRVEREAQRLPLQRRIFTAHFRDGGSGGTRFEPHQVWRHTATGRLAAAALEAADEVVVYEPVRPGTVLTIAGQAYTVLGVTGSGPFTATIAPTLAAAASAGDAFTYEIDLLWDYLEWDVARGTLRFEGTELLPLGGIATPLNLAVEDEDDGEVSLSWDEVDDADGYTLYYDTASGPPYGSSEDVAVGDLDDDSNPAWTVDGLSNETLYWFRVRAWRGDPRVYSGYSNEVSGTPQGPIPLEPNTWYESGSVDWPLPDGTLEAEGIAVAALGDVLHYVGGLQSGSYLTTHHTFDTAANAWGSAAALPAGRAHGQLFAAGGKLYYIGGLQSGGSASANVYEYDPGTDAWTQLTLDSMPAARALFGAAESGGTLYVVGGYNGSARQDDVYLFDPSQTAGSRWSSVTLVPVNIQESACAVIDGKLIVACGYIGSWTNVTRVYDIAGNSWSTADNCPTALASIQQGHHALNGELYIAFGSKSGPVQNVPTLYAFDPDRSPGTQWATRQQFSGQRGWPSACALGGILYVYGGTDPPGPSAEYLTSLLAYVPPEGANRPY